MNFAELQREVKSIILDASPEILVSIPDYVNEAVQQIAEDIKFPELKQITSVTTTSTYWVNMPTGFSSRLTYAGNSMGQYNILPGGVEELIAIYPALDEVGDIAYVVLEGNVLYYHPVPTTVTAITCIGYFVPATLVNDTDTPSFIPDYLQRESIVNMAAAKAYNLIEDEVDTGKVNTKLFLNLAMNGENKIREYVSRRRPVTGSSIWSV